MGKQRLKGKAEDHHQATSSLSTLSHLSEAKGKILKQKEHLLILVFDACVLLIYHQVQNDHSAVSDEKPQCYWSKMIIKCIIIS